MESIAIKFGQSLDQDNFKECKKLLSADCSYNIGDKILQGPENIVSSYEQNMIEGRKKLDLLEWGKSKAEKLNDIEYYIHFTDYLTHKGLSYIHRCKQKLTFNKVGKIIQIDHVNDEMEQKKLNQFYKKVGLK